MKKNSKLNLKFFKILIVLLLVGLVTISKQRINTNKTQKELKATEEQGKFVVSELPYNIKFTKIATGGGTTLALAKDGNMWAWGENGKGAFGNGTTTDSRTPIKVSTQVKFVDISTSSTNSAAIDESGNIWTWGTNIYGAIGDGQYTTSITAYATTPKKVTSNTKYVKVIVRCL